MEVAFAPGTCVAACLGGAFPLTGFSEPEREVCGDVIIVKRVIIGRTRVIALVAAGPRVRSLLRHEAGNGRYEQR